MQTDLIETSRSLARSGEYENAAKIERALVKAGYSRVEVEGYLFGRAARSELNALCKNARRLAVEDLAPA